jgi:protein-disulfide isomerase
VTTRTDPPPQSRRARRAAERANAKPTRRTRANQRGGPSPLVWITAVVGIVAVVMIGALVVMQGGSTTTADEGLVEPTVVTPQALADGRAIGKADAPVTLDVWSDFQCPACRQYALIVEPELILDYVTPGTLRIVHHDAAFQGRRVGAAYDESVESGAGARCAASQDRYWPYHDWLFTNQSGENKGAFAEARLRAMARSAGLDVAAWDACRATGTEQAAVRAETEQGVAQGLDATPTMYLDGEKIVGVRSAAELGQKIQAAAAS